MGWQFPSPSSSSFHRQILRWFASSPSLPIHETLSGGTAESLAYRRSMFRPPPIVRTWQIPWNSNNFIGTVDAPLKKQNMMRDPSMPLRPPPSVMTWPVHCNSCSFIGTVVAPVRRYKMSYPTMSGAYTFLKLKTPSSIDPAISSSSHFQILLTMWNKLAEISIRYLKPNDIVYVSGPLNSYEKVDEQGDRHVFYKVIVRDLNYVKYKRQNQTSLKHEGLRNQELAGPSSNAADHEETIRERLHLWQLFFSNPYEWWDNRQSKINSRCPDFKHKDTRECLWISPDDPPWVRKQLELCDTKKVGTYRKNRSGWSEIDEWKISDLE
ncbi:protein OSB1, mitochondrial-like isoform X1 [Typha latifolia]|uniref:protein OSB1, mitochondrial-like isoform X1 n=1 Tax=Typha latifolia TaxID=4733 RepID=UPI003C2E4661